MSSTLRITGLASGMDIDSMVKSLMTAERMPLDKLKQKQQVLEWQRDDYRSMNTLLLNFRSDITNMKLTSNYRARTTTSTDDTKVTATATGVASQGSYTLSNVTQLASAATLTNGEAISASSSAKVDLNAGLYANQSAFSNQTFGWKVGTVASKSVTVTTAGTDQDMQLDSINTGITLQDISSMNVKVNGQSYKVTEVADMSQVTTTPATNEVYVDSTGKMKFGTSLAVGSSISVDYFANKTTDKYNPSTDTKDFQLTNGSINNDDGSFQFKVENNSSTTTYVIDPNSTGTTRNLIVSGDTTATAVGTIDMNTGKISFTNAVAAGSTVSVDYKQNYTNFSITTYGEDGKPATQNVGVQGTNTLNQVISKVNNSNAGVTMFYDSFSDRLTMTRKATGDFNTSGSEIETSGDFINQVLKFDKSGTNFPAAVETGGADAVFDVNGLHTQRHSNTFDMNGVTFTLKTTFTPGVTVGINNDTDTVYNNIKGFIDKYNTLIDTINKKTTEEYYRDYPPLTDDQKTQLSDTQQQQWTDKAKSGLLRNDTILDGVLNTMRTNFYAPVTNSQVSQAYNQLAKVGITTTANFLDGGKLQIDDAKLKAAIQADPDSVENLFRGTGTSSSENGILQRLYDTVNNTMDSLKQKAGNTYSTNKQFSIGMELDSVTTQISTFEDRMTQVENRYYAQFTAMEQAIQKSNSQASYFSQQFSGGSGQ